MKRLFLAILFILGCSGTAYAQCAGTTNCTATALTPAAVQAALSSINQDNTTLHLPAGSADWTSGVSYTANFSTTISGAGAISSTTNGQGTTGSDQTSIMFHTSGSPLFSIETVAGKSFRFTGIAMIENSTSPFTNNGILFLHGNSSSVRIDHCHWFLYIGGTTISFFIGGAVTGVADHVYIQDRPGIGVTNNVAFHNGIGWNGSNPATDPNGYHSWSDTDHFGSSQFFFMEDSRSENGYIGDAHDGARYVFRHNTFTGIDPIQMADHGVTNSPAAATRAAEVYANTFNNTGNNGNPPYSLNSGTLLFWGNTITGGYRGGVSIGYDFRTTAGGGGNYNYTGNWGYCGVAAGGPTNWDRNLDSSGYACTQQPGRGSGDLLTGSSFPGIVNSATGTVSWPHHALSPIYVFNNIFTPQFYTADPLISQHCNGVCANNREYYIQFGNLANPGTFNGTAGVGQGTVNPTTAGAYTGAPNCTAGVDTANGNIAAPGVGWWNTTTQHLWVCTTTNTWTDYYTPFTYPHPLAGGGGVIPPPPPNAPSGLTGSVAGSTVSLSWTASSGSPVPTAYTLYRGTVHGGPYSVIKSGLTSLSTTDTPPNGTWFYVVAGYVGGIVTNISGTGTTATVTCTTTCTFPTTATLTVGGNSTSGFNGTFSSTGQPNSSTFTYASSTTGTGTGGGAWQTASESPKSNEITVGVPASLTATFLPASRTFAATTVGSSTAPQTFTYTNTSAAGNTITISAKTITGTNSGDFSQTNNCPSLLLSGTSCTFNVTFTPTAAGARTATVSVTDNAAGSPHTVTVNGTGVATTPAVSLTPTFIDFGEQTVSTTSTQHDISLMNTGTGTLTITSITPSGDFGETTTCGGTLAPAQACIIHATFTPTATGLRTGTISIADNAAGTPHVVTLQGTGITTKCAITGLVDLTGQAGVCQ